MFYRYIIIHVIKATRLRIACAVLVIISTYFTLFYEFKKILLLVETHRGPNCLIGYPSETNMPDWIPIRDQHA